MMILNSLRKNQQGFGVLLILLAVLITGLLGGVGYYIYHSNKTNKNQAQTSTTNSKAASNSTAAKSAAVQKNATLYIKEWGTSFKYAGSVTLSYTSNQTPELTGMFVSSNELGAVDANCSAASAGIGGLNRAKVDAVANFSGHDKSDMNLTGKEYLAKYPSESAQLGDYVYTYYIRPNNDCSGTEAAQTEAALKSIFE